MDTQGLVSLFELFNKVLLPIGGTCIFVGFCYVLFRTRSTHLFRLKTWQLIVGKEPVPDETLRRFIEDRTSLMAFRHTGVDVRSIKSARRLVHWLEENDEDIADVVAVGSYFNREKLQLKTNLPGRRTCIVLAVMIISLWAFCLLLVPAFSTERGYFQLRESGQLFSAKVGEVRSETIYWWQDDSVLTPDLCLKAPSQGIGFQPSDVPLLCSFLNAPDLESSIVKALFAQRIALGMLCSLIAMFLVVAINKLLKIAHAWDMHRRLQARTANISTYCSARMRL